MEALILAIIIAYAIKKAAESGHLHWQSARGANRRGTRGQPVRQRAASAARHDAAYWAEQVRGGFPQVRHGLYMGWHAGHVAQLERALEREKARTGHLEKRASTLQQAREQRRRQAEILQEIRAAAAEPGSQATRPTRRPDGQPETGADTRFFDLRESGYEGPIDRDGNIPDPQDPEAARDLELLDALRRQGKTTATEGNTMSSDTTYTQQMTELKAIRRDAEEEVNSVRRKRMLSRLDVLMSLGLDSATLSEAAAIDDALRQQEKAAQETLDAADAAIRGLQQRHGGIKAAVDDAPVDKPAEPEFYQD
jgi:hypothetical protein